MLNYPITLVCVVLVTALAVVTFALAMSGPEKSPPPPKTLISLQGLSRFPVLDSKQEIRTGIFIACKAYSNRPGFDINAPVTDSTLGFRVVSDCRTVRGQ